MPWSTTSRSNVAETCGSCHVQAENDFAISVHAEATAVGSTHAATCIDCHDSHATLEVSDPESATSTLQVSEQTCATCHESVSLTEMHRLPRSVVDDFSDSFHGLAGKAGDRRVANCASCHGYHDILPSWNSLSRIHEDNLVETCGACHEGATAGFARGGIHHPGTGFGHRLVDFVESMYIMMIGATIGLMVLHNVLDMYRRLRDRRRHTSAAAVSAEISEKKYLRFTLNERIQHWLLAWCFIVLAVTGFALKYGWALPGVSAEINETIRALSHRVAAAIFLALGVYHLGYLAFTTRGRQLVRAVLPRFDRVTNFICCFLSCERLGPPSGSDWRELVQNVKYNVGLAPSRPLFGRFNYAEKMEYLALIWGSGLMAVTGIALWFEVPFLNLFPYWGIQLSTVVHYYEGILATLAIIVWHFYFVMINPDVFPLSKTMITGKLSHEEMEEEHPLELRDLEGTHDTKKPGAPDKDTPENTGN